MVAGDDRSNLTSVWNVVTFDLLSLTYTHNHTHRHTHDPSVVWAGFCRRRTDTYAKFDEHTHKIITRT